MWGLWVLGWIVFSSVFAQAAAWMTMETDHFLITFEEGQESIAQQAAYYLEMSYDQITQELGHEPSDKTRIVLGDFSDLANGFATPGYGYNEEEYLLTYGGPNAALRAGIDTWLHTLAVHELTHTIHIDMHAGATSFTRALFGRMGRPLFPLPDLTNPNGDLPVYLVEGFAVYMETINTDGGRLRSSLWEMMMRADFANERIMTRDQSSGRYSYARYTGDAPYYLYGAYFCDYIARSYGQDKLFDIMRDNSKGNAFFIDGVFQRVLGKSLPAVWDEFIVEAKGTYAQQMADLENQGLTSTQPLTRTGQAASSPNFSPDGKTVAYAQSGKDLAAALRLVDVESGNNRTAVIANTVHSGEGFSWSPDGQKLVYGRFDLQGSKLVNDLYAFDLKTGKELRLTVGARASGPTWSPDGQTIVFVAKTTPLQTSVMAMKADGTNVRTLVEGQNEMQFSSPRFSPYGRQLAVAVQSYGGFNDIYLLNADGGDLRPITQDRAMDFAPQWSPDGQYVLFNSDRTGVHNAFAYRLSDQQLFQVTNVPFGAFSPAMSPDGRTIAFINYDVKGYDVHLMDADPQAWKPFPLQRQTLPQPPDYAAFSGDFQIRPYSPVPTLLPHFWRPVLTGPFGALIQSEDLLNQTGYLLLASVDLSGAPVALLRITHQFADYPTQSGEAAAPSVAVDFSPASIGMSASLPLSQSLSSSQTLNLMGTVGALGVVDTPTGPLALQGFSVGGGWGTSFSSGRDGLMGHYSLGLNAGMAFTGAGTSPSAGAQLGATWTLGGEFQLGANAQVDALQGIGSGTLEASFPLFYLEKQLGTWPIYFQKVQLSAFAGANVAFDGRFSDFYGASLVFSTYLWYNFPISLSFGVVYSNGQFIPTFSL